MGNTLGVTDNEHKYKMIQRRDYYREICLSWTWLLGFYNGCQSECTWHSPGVYPVKIAADINLVYPDQPGFVQLLPYLLQSAALCVG